MALQSIRYGGGVWKQQEETRVELQRRLEQSEAMLKEAKVEVDRVHTQCVVLLQEKNELKVNLSKADTQLRRQDEELHAAKQNVAEFMELLTRANQDRDRLERERVAAIQQCQWAQDQQQSTAEASEHIQKQYEASDAESHRLRDLLYETQEKNACQQQELQQLRRQVEVLAHSNQAKDSQVVSLIRERDVYAQTLAHYRSRIMEGKPLPRDRSPMKAPVQTKTVRHRDDNSSEQVTWTEIEPSNSEDPTHAGEGERIESPVQALVEFEKQKQRLRAAALQAKSRFERERETNTALQKRVEALEKSHEALLVRFREASKPRQRVKTTTRVVSVKAVECSDEDSTQSVQSVQAA